MILGDLEAAEVFELRWDPRVPRPVVMGHPWHLNADICRVEETADGYYRVRVFNFTKGRVQFLPTGTHVVRTKERP